MIEVQEPGVYPLKWSEFIGQETTKKQIQLATKSARIRKVPCEHVLLTGPPGTGKTALTKLAAREMRTHVLEVTGQIPISDARRYWPDLPPRSVIFWDEFHRSVESGKRNAEWLLHFLTDNVLLGPFGPEKLPPLTIFAATTDPEVLPDTIVGRFMRARMGPYSDDEAARIVLVMAKTVLEAEGLPRPSRHNARAIATAALNNPRMMRRLLTTLRDIAVVDPKVWLGSRYQLGDLFAFADITEDGLDAVARQYLLILLNEFKDGAGVASLKDRLGEAFSSSEHVLVQRGYVGKTRSGRRLTAAGLVRAKQLEQAA